MDPQTRRIPRRPLVAIVLLTIAIVALLANNIADGWTTLGAVGIGCLVVAIGALAVQARGADATS